jgi:hypothetical protein
MFVVVIEGWTHIGLGRVVGLEADVEWWLF